MTLLPCISIHQPWASFIAHGIKRTEGRTHTRFANLVGKRIAIHATKTWDAYWFNKVPMEILRGSIAKRLVGKPEWVIQAFSEFSMPTAARWKYPTGSIIATANVENMIVVASPEFRETPEFDRRRWLEDLEREQLTYVDDSDVLYRLADVQRLAVPIPARGHQGVWFVEIPA